MRMKGIVVIGLSLLFVSQLLMSFGYDFLMSQRPIDFAHWALLLGSVLMLPLWFNLPANFSKNIGLFLMTIGVIANIGMCVIDFILWAAHGEPDTKKAILDVVFNTPSIGPVFLNIGPALFYGGISIATYGLFMSMKWQVVLVNLGALLIGLGHVVFHNHKIPVLGSLLLFVGLVYLIGIKTLQGNEKE